MNVLSLFDGISAGRLALQRAGLEVTKYYRSEIDKYASQVAMNHFPNDVQLGVKDVVINSSLVSAQNRYRHYWCNWDE